MGYTADITIESPDNCTVALVEVRDIRPLDSSIAAEIRANLTRYFELPVSPFFLVVSRETGFLWRNDSQTGNASHEFVEFSMRPVMERFVRGYDDNLDFGGTLEYVIYQWLNALAWSGDETDLPLAGTEFQRAITGAKVLMETRV